MKRILVNAYLNLINDLLKLKRYEHVIEMGYGDGAVVEAIKDKVGKVTVVEGDKKLVEQTKKSHKDVTIVHSLFEEFEAKDKADLVLGNHVLEHVNQPQVVLERTKQWLKPNGIALFSVPNATSLHRRIGVRMGLLGSIYDLNEQDKRVGHQRIYDEQSFLRDLKKSGFKIKKFGGFNLKLVSQKQMKDWSDELLQAIYEVSLQCPAELCSNLYAICRK